MRPCLAGRTLYSFGLDMGGRPNPFMTSNVVIKFLRNVFLLGTLAVLTVLAGQSIRIVRTYQHWAQTPPAKSDAALVLGHRLESDRPSAELVRRLEKAVELYAAGVAPVLMVSGGKSEPDARSESDVMKNYLMANGVPPEQVVTESQARSTRENFRFSLPLLKQRHIRSLLVVTTKSHLCRAMIMAESQGLEAAGIVTTGVAADFPDDITAVLSVITEAVKLTHDDLVSLRRTFSK